MNLKSKRFYQSVIPAICATIVSGLYVVVDGIFIGNGVGTEGLAAVNIALPLVLFISAVIMMLSMGGGTLTSIALGEGNIKKSNNIFRITFLVTIIFSIIVSIICLLVPEMIGKFLGASGKILDLSAAYIFYYVMFIIFSSTSIVLSVFVKNDNNSNLAMYGMIVGAITNIFLDWLFIFPFEMGIEGAAIASGLGQIFSCLILLTHFIKKKGNLRLGIPSKEKGILLEIIKIGMPEFITQLSLPVSTLLFNLLIIEAYGDIGVSAFSVASYIISVIVLAFIGLAQGMQPLLSRSLGERKIEDIDYYRDKGLKLNIAMAVVSYLIIFFFGEYIIKMFNNNLKLISFAKKFLMVYGISFLFVAVNLVYTTYFLAIKKTKQSLVIAILRSFVMNIGFIIVTPLVLGEKFIFLGIIIAEGVVMMVSFTLYKKEKLSVKTMKKMQMIRG